MMVPHYTFVDPVYCSGLDLAGQAFEFALVEKKVTIVVGQVMEVEEQEESCIWASTPDDMHSTEVATENRIEMNGWLVGHAIQM